MRGEADDAAYLWDMLDAAKAALSFSKDINFEQYSHDRKAQLAVEIPWRQIVAQRNVLAHEYGEIQQERLWVLLQNQLPQLILALENCMSLKYPAI